MWSKCGNISKKTFGGWWCGLSVLWGSLLWLCMPPLPFYFTYIHWGSVWLLGSLCIAAALVDWHSHILPDVLTLFFCIPAALFTIGTSAYVTHTIDMTMLGGVSPLGGAIFGFVVLKGIQWQLRRKYAGVEQLGSGDAKLMLSLGALVGMAGVLPTLVLACLFLWPMFKLRQTRILPFGPALVLSAFVVLLTGLRWPPM